MNQNCISRKFVHISIVVVVAIVVIFTNEIEGTCSNTIDIPCKSGRKCYKELDHLDANDVTTDTCIWLHEDQYLHRVISFQNVSFVTIANLLNASTVRITCQNHTKSGFEFLSGNNIQLRGLQFIGCGHRHLSTSITPTCLSNKTFTGTLPTPSIYSAVYFNNTRSVELTAVQFDRSAGYSVVTYDVKGNITMNGLICQNNSRIPYDYNDTECHGYASGGAIYMEYTRETLSPTTDSTIAVSNCTFTCNKGDTVTSIPEGQGIEERHIGFGRGGAFGMVIMGNASNIRTTISNSTFTGNEAAWGGSVYIRFRDLTSRNAFRIRSSTFKNNSANYSGGAVFSTTTQRGDNYNNVTIEHCHFQGNNAPVGGAFAALPCCGDKDSKSSSTFISNTRFVDNKANLGSAINVRLIAISLTDVFIQGNQAIDQGSSISGQGAIYAFESRLTFRGSSEFSNNMDTALVSDCTETHIQGAVKYISNKGENGGALSFYGHSHLQLYDETDLQFQSNSAYRRGGAIYVELPGPSFTRSIVVGLQFRKCFFTFNNARSLEDGIANFTGRVKFDNNSAEINGNSIYISSLASCSIHANDSSSTLINWNGFTFTPNTSQISTRAVRIRSHAGDWRKWPGEEFSPKVELIDEIGNHVSEAVNVEIIQVKGTQAQIDTSNSRFIVSKHNNITLTLIGNNQGREKSFFNITISLASNNFISSSIYNLTLQPCYFGYTLLYSRCRCNVLKNEAKGIAFCIDNQIYLYKNRWANPNQSAIITDAEVTADCPRGYCKDCTKKKNTTDSMYGQVCLYKPQNPDQCDETRDPKSLLCSECKATLSVQIGSEKCVDCSGVDRYAFFKLLGMFLVVFFGVVLVILLNIDIYTTYLNGFLYYYQVVRHLTPASFTPMDFTQFITGITSLQSGGGMVKFCLFNNFNNLQKNCFNYFIPVSMVFSLWLVSIIFSRRLSRNNCMKAFIIISVFAYQDIARISFVLLKYVLIDDNNTPYVWVYAKIEYFSKEHQPYAIIAILVVVFIVIGFPVCLIYSSELVAMNCKCFQNPFTKMMAVFENFNTCFKPKYIRFAGFFFISRAVVLGVETFVPKTPNQNVVQVIICCIVCFMFAYMKPYKNKWLNVFDLTVLVNLVIVSILSLTMRSSMNLQRRWSSLAINLFMLVPFVVVAIRLMYIYLPYFYESGKTLYRKIIYKKISQTAYPQRLLISPSSDEDANGEDEDDEREQEDDKREQEDDQTYWESQN